MSETAFVLSGSLPFNKLVESGAHYTVKVPKELFTRLAKSCESLLSDASLEVTFKRDLQGLSVIEGRVSMEVSVICQRCFKPFTLTLESVFSSTPDKEKARSLRIDEKLDLIELNPDGTLDVIAYLEDCLILELPLIPEHTDEAECELQGSDWSFGKIEEAPHPFAALSGLKEALSAQGEGEESAGESSPESAEQGKA